MTGLFSRTTLRNMDTSLLRAVLRERAHHSFEYQLYKAIFAGAKLAAGLGGKVREILDIAYERGLSPDLPDVHWARQLLDIAGRVRGGERVAIPRNRPQPLDEAGMTVVDQVIFGRRWIRQRAASGGVRRQLAPTSWRSGHRVHRGRSHGRTVPGPGYEQLQHESCRLHDGV